MLWKCGGEGEVSHWAKVAHAHRCERCRRNREMFVPVAKDWELELGDKVAQNGLMPHSGIKQSAQTGKAASCTDDAFGRPCFQ